ncbi:MAG: FecR domain-containing protein [Breznakibacter sp.]
MEDFDDIPNLITGNIQSGQKEKVLSEIFNNPEGRDFYKKAKLTWAYISASKLMDNYRIEKSYEKMRRKIQPERPGQQGKRAFLKYAATVFAIIGLAYIAFLLGQRNPGPQSVTYQYSTVKTEYGQMAHVVLPDSSEVWLNAGSTLTYSNQFSVHNRDVSLAGEAYFDVKRNGNLPLVVSIGDLRVKVLGTKFNVNAYPNDNKFNVVLESGRVELGDNRSPKLKFTLSPGELGEYDTESGNIKVQPINSYYHTSWRNGTLLFNDAPMAEVIKRLERKFNVSVTVKNPGIYKSIITANFQNESLDEILEFIRFTSPIRYKKVRTEGVSTPKIIMY